MDSVLNSAPPYPLDEVNANAYQDNLTPKVSIIYNIAMGALELLKKAYHHLDNVFGLTCVAILINSAEILPFALTILILSVLFTTVYYVDWVKNNKRIKDLSSLIPILESSQAQLISCKNDLKNKKMQRSEELTTHIQSTLEVILNLYQNLQALPLTTLDSFDKTDKDYKLSSLHPLDLFKGTLECHIEYPIVTNDQNDLKVIQSSLVKHMELVEKKLTQSIEAYKEIKKRCEKSIQK